MSATFSKIYLCQVSIASFLSILLLRLSLCTIQIVLVSYSYKRNPIPRVREQVRRLFCPPLHTCETIADMEIGVLAHYRHIIRIETRTMFTLDYLRAERYADFYVTKSVFSCAKLSTEVGICLIFFIILSRL